VPGLGAGAFTGCGVFEYRGRHVRRWDAAQRVGCGVEPLPERVAGALAAEHVDHPCEPGVQPSHDRHRIGGVPLTRPPLAPEDDHHEHREHQRQEHLGSGRGESPEQQEQSDRHSARHGARATKRYPIGRIRGAPSQPPDTTRAGNPRAFRQRRAGYRAGPRRFQPNPSPSTPMAPGRQRGCSRARWRAGRLGRRGSPARGR